MSKSNLIWGALFFVLGVALGGYLFAGVQPRSFLDLRNCGSSCYQLNELTGLMASVGLQRAPGLLPKVVKETDRCISVNYPDRKVRLHFIILPKKDIKDIASVSLEDGPFVLECLAHVRALVTEHHLRDYRVYTNGPMKQDVRYLHFHLVVQ
jgi:Scavenger mRNA decapping enzyme C-term binding